MLSGATEYLLAISRFAMKVWPSILVTHPDLTCKPKHVEFAGQPSRPNTAAIAAMYIRKMQRIQLGNLYTVARPVILLPDVPV